MNKIAAFLTSAVIAVMAVLPIATAAPINLIANPSLETAASAAMPANWQKNSWGTNTASFTYEATGRTGNRSATVKVSNYKSGDAKWYANDVAVTPNTTYTFNGWYKGTAKSGLVAAMTATNGTISYIWKGDFAASTAWKQITATYTTPANAKTLSFYHYAFSNGTLTIDDQSLTGPDTTPTPTPPTVQLTSPANNSAVANTVAIAANAGGTTPITSVQFKLDGANLGALDMTAPYTIDWDTKTATNGAHTLTAVATNNAGLSTTAANVVVNVNNVTTPVPTAPVVNITAPAANATIVGTQDVTATATSNVAITGVQFKLNGANLGAVDTVAPYSVSWDSKTVANGQYNLTAVATNSAGQSTTAAAVTVNVNNPPAPTAPVVTVTAPAANATVAGTQAVTATATSNVAITGVQFKLDGANLGTADTAAPYTVDWDTKTTTNGNHILSATATNSAGQSTTAANIPVTVNNVVTPPTPPTGTNLLPNPGVETNTTGWLNGSWGTNTHTLTHETTGHNSNRSLKATMTAYTNGDAKWYFADVAVTPGQNYSYTSWYKSNVETELDAAVTLANGTVQYYWLASVPAATDWTQLKVQFTAPTNAKSITIFQALAKVGYVQIDDTSFAPFTPAQFNRAMVSLTFDDGWRNIYTNALPLLQKYNLLSTQYLLTDTVTYPDYMTVAMMQAFKNQGSEIASHTNSHADLTTLTPAQLTAELQGAQNQLRTWFGVPGVANNFASPYGAYNGATLNEIKKYYRSHRSTDVGYNSKDNFDIYNIKVQNILDGTTSAQVAAWVAQAQADKTWLVLVYHAVGADPNPNQEDYSITPAKLDTQLNQIKQSGIAVLTVEQALTEILAQQ